MLLSDDWPTLRPAKSAGVFSCYYHKPVPGVATRVPADFNVDSMKGVCKAVEELNGISFRSSSTGVYSKYGVART